MASTYLTRTLGTPTLNTKYTFSVWVKRSTPSTANTLIGGSSSAPDTFIINSNNKLTYYANDGSSASISTTRLLRDTSAFYHLVLAVDTTQSTASDRIKMYINGTLQTAFDTSTYPAQNYVNKLNSAVPHRIGQNPTYNSETFDGLMTHIHFIDGTQYQASDFGEFDANGVWIPKLTPSVTYGNNGFFLKFNEGALGTDSSPNGNNFTVNGSLTPAKDTPTNVYATMNSLDNYIAGGTFANGNNTITTVNTGYTYNTSTMGVNKGKWYWECKWSAQPTGSANQVLVGIAKRTSPSTTTWLGSADYTYAYQGTGGVHNSNTILVTYTTWSIGDIIGVALDMDNNRLYFSRNGTWQGSSDPANGTNPISITAPDSTSGDSGFYFPAFGDGNNSLQETGQFNFGNGFFGTTAVASAGSNGNGSIFEYDCPSGYYALNLKNLATYG